MYSRYQSVAWDVYTFLKRDIEKKRGGRMEVSKNIYSYMFNTSGVEKEQEITWHFPKQVYNMHKYICDWIWEALNTVFGMYIFR